MKWGNVIHPIKAIADSELARRAKEKEAEVEILKKRAVRMARQKTEYDKALLSKPCPHRGMKKCTKKCVHFQGSYLAYAINYGELEIVKPAYCKLWAND